MLPKINNSDLYKKYKQFLDIRVIGLIAFGVVVILVAWSSLRVLQMNYELQKQETSLRQRNQLQKLENENLRLKNVYFESDEYLELSARRQFNKAAPGEKLYIIPESVAMSKTVELPKTERAIQTEAAMDKPKYQQNLEAWRDFFFHLNKE
ncbi:MAG TPA: septum formation initiator family protein [Patescibacteria group bacterium]|nr:septum formation initiator family protein [Patescibacteria group bacterium]